MAIGRSNPRVPEAEVGSLFVDRWSPRSFAGDPVGAAALASLFEAARWAPSCYNEQPWRFVYAVQPADRARFVAALVEKNQVWAGAAPVLVFVLARRAFARSGKPNRHAAFDAGAAWMSLALQARRLGLYAHAMAGFDQAAARAAVGAEAAAWDVLAAVAVGYRGARERLPADLAEREVPGPRLPLAEVATEGRLPAAAGPAPGLQT